MYNGVDEWRIMVVSRSYVEGERVYGSKEAYKGEAQQEWFYSSLKNGVERRCVGGLVRV